MTSYDKIPFLPHVITECVCDQPYTAQEVSKWGRGQPDIDKIEALRKGMTPEQIQEFCRLTDARCRAAHAIQAPWFMKCVRSKSNVGRDQMYVWIRHWMVGFLRNPDHFRAEMNQPKLEEEHANSNQTQP